MKLVIARDLLAEALSSVQSVVSGRSSTLPVLSNVLLTVNDTDLQLTATNLDVAIQRNVLADVEESGAVTVPARTLTGIVKELSSPEVELQLESRNILTIRCGSSVFKLRGLPAEEFPPIEIPAEEPLLSLPQERLRKMIRQTGFAASTDETRYILNGLYFHLLGSKLALVATDGRRLALAVEALSDEEGQNETLSPVVLIQETEKDTEKGFVIPTRTVQELQRLLGDAGTVNIALTENRVAFFLHGGDNEQTILTSKIIEGTYPDYRQVIPKQSQIRAVIVREELLHALRRAELVTSDRASLVKLTFEPNQLAIMARSPDIGEAVETLAIQYNGERFEIGFNPVYLLDVLRALENDQIIMELTDEFTPGLIKVDEPFLYVVMPMRLSQMPPPSGEA